MLELEARATLQPAPAFVVYGNEGFRTFASWLRCNAVNSQTLHVREPHNEECTFCEVARPRSFVRRVQNRMLVIKVALMPRARCGLTMSVRRLCSEVPAAAPLAKDRPRMKPPQVAKPFEEVTMEEVRAALESKSIPTEDKRAAADEIGGPKGEEPTRFGDWERKGRVTDF